MNGFLDLPSLSEVFSSDFMFSSRGLGLLLWLGLLALTIALVILSRTRWGQVKPLSKCVALSIFAHILFVGYAWGTRLIFEPPPSADRQVIKLTIVEAGDSSTASDESQRDPNPWEHVTTPSNLDLDPGNLEKVETQVESQDLTYRLAAAPLPRASAPLIDSSNVSEKPRPVPQGQSENDTLRATTPGASSVEIEKPNVQRNDSPNTFVSPSIRGPSRMRVADRPRPVTKRTEAQESATDINNSQARVQRLVDVPLPSDRSSAIASQVDSLRQATNQLDTLRQAAQPSIAAKIDLKANQSTQAASSATSSGSPKMARNDTSASSQATRPEGTATTTSIPKRAGDGEQLPSLYQNRVTDDRSQIVAQNGGDSRTEEAVARALRWLAEHQSADGRWDASQYGAGVAVDSIGQDRNGAGAHADTGITALALLAFLGNGQTHLHGEYRKNIQHALEFLLRSQGSDGNLAGEAKLFAMMYCHGMSLLAISEAYAISGDQRLKPYVERGVQFTLYSQNATTGGWRYRPGDRGDMSQFGWQVMALKSAELGGIPIPARTRTGMLRFLSSVSSGSFGGLASYRAGERTSRTMTAEALACRFFLDQFDHPQLLQEATNFIAQEPPQEGKPNLYYWYYGTLAMYHAKNKHWSTWNNSLKRQLLTRQRLDGNLEGSWDPDTVWGSYGGRVFSTAMASLCLEVYYRYLPVLENSGR